MRTFIAIAALMVGTGLAPLAPAIAQGVAPGGGIANTTGIGSGLGSPGGTAPSYPNGTTQPALPSPPAPGGGAPSALPGPRPSMRPSQPTYSFESRPRKPAIVPLELPSAPEANISFLKGCWRTDVFRQAGQSGLSTWCFDAHGTGKVLYTRINQPDFFCNGAAVASYAGGTLHLQSQQLRCKDGSALALGELDCRQNGAEGALCSGGVPTATLTERWSVRLYRVR